MANSKDDQFPLLVALKAGAPAKSADVSLYQDNANQMIITERAVDAPFSPFTGERMVLESDTHITLSAEEQSELVKIGHCATCDKDNLSTVHMVSSIMSNDVADLSCVSCGTSYPVEVDISQYIELASMEDQDEDESDEDESGEDESEEDDQDTDAMDAGDTDSDGDEDGDLESDYDESGDEEPEDEPSSEDGSDTATEGENLEDESDDESEDESEDDCSDEASVDDTAEVDLPDDFFDDDDDEDEISDEAGFEDNTSEEGESDDSSDALPSEEESENEPSKEDMNKVGKDPAESVKATTASDGEDAPEELFDEKLEPEDTSTDFVVREDAEIDLSKAVLDLVYLPNSTLYYVFANQHPIATLSPNFASEHTASLFGRDELVRLFKNVASKKSDGSLQEFGYRPFHSRVTTNIATASKIQQIEELASCEVESRVSVEKASFQQGLRISLAASMKGIWENHGNPIRDALIRALDTAGVGDARLLVDSVFAAEGTAFMNSLLDSANAIASKPEAVRNEIESMVNRAKFQVSSDVASKLSDSLTKGSVRVISRTEVGGTDEEADFQDSASVSGPKNNVGKFRSQLKTLVNR